jgi:hypothetical protein
MEKLRNAQREANNINQELQRTDTQYPSSSSRGSYSPYEPTHQRYDYNPNANFLVEEGSFSSGKGWRPPNIRYRHIEDQKQPEITQVRTDPVVESRNKERL